MVNNEGFNEVQLNQLKTMMTRALEPIETSIKIMNQKQTNSLLGRSDVLVEVARDSDGNENLPSGAANVWNKQKSIALLQFYGEDENTDTEEEKSVNSRPRRLRIARKIGVTRTQLNFAQMDL